MKILLVEDDDLLADAIARALQAENFVVDVASNGEDGQHLGDTETYDAAVLDLGLPKVNGVAVLRAWRMFLSYLFRGRVLAWDKTMHDFPTSSQLLRRRQKLGDLLHSWQALDEGSLGKALDEQTRTQMPLGHILVSNGWLDEETLAEAIAYARARTTNANCC